MNGFIIFMNSGGAINWLILALYTAVLAVFSARLVYFFRTRRGAERNQVMRISGLFSHNSGRPQAALTEMIDREAALLKKEMEKGLPFLSFAGTVSPLLGLLGTITGLMSAFSQIEMRGAAVDISFLSGGIKEAMTTTATGLVTAICALGCGKLFENLSAARLDEMAAALSVLEEAAREKSA